MKYINADINHSSNRPAASSKAGSAEGWNHGLALSGDAAGSFGARQRCASSGPVAPAGHCRISEPAAANLALRPDATGWPGQLPDAGLGHAGGCRAGRQSGFGSGGQASRGTDFQTDHGPDHRAVLRPAGRQVLRGWDVLVHSWLHCVPLCAAVLPVPGSDSGNSSTQTQQEQGQQGSQEHRVNVNTISTSEAPSYNLGVHDPTQETHRVCTVNGAPAYAATPAGAASGKCSSRRRSILTLRLRARREPTPGLKGMRASIGATQTAPTM